MNESDFIENLFFNRSDMFPLNPQDSNFHMDLNGRIYVYLDGAWAEVEDIKIDLIDQGSDLDKAWEDIIVDLGIERLL